MSEKITPSTLSTIAAKAAEVTVALIFSVVLLSGETANAREAANFGFGKPPSFSETRELILGHLRLSLKDPSSVRDLAIGKPIADCYRRGIGRRDVCGYKICVAYNAKNSYGAYIGRKVYVYWKLNGWGTQVFQNAGACPLAFSDWDGSSPVELGNFCAIQGKHPDCGKGRKEEYVVETISPEASASDETGDRGYSRCTVSMRDRMRDRGISEEDIADVCGCPDEMVESLKSKGLSKEDISSICMPD